MRTLETFLECCFSYKKTYATLYYRKRLTYIYIYFSFISSLKFYFSLKQGVKFFPFKVIPK